MKSKLSILAALCALLCLLRASQAAIESCRYGLRLCAELILPSLFPFFVLSMLLSRLGLPDILDRLFGAGAARLFRVSGAGITALFIGLLGGYPLGAACVAELERNRRINPTEAARLLAFCNNSGPAFIVGAVGAGVFGSVRTGLLLYAVHALAALLTGLLLRGRSDAPEPAAAEAAPPQPLSQALPEAVRQAVLACLNVCGFVVCFTVFTGLLDANGLLSLAAGRMAQGLGLSLHAARALLCGFWELGGGVGALRGLAPEPKNLALAAALLGWGGISVHFQTLALLADSDVKSAPHTAGRLLSALFSALLAYGVFSLF